MRGCCAIGCLFISIMLKGQLNAFHELHPAASPLSKHFISPTAFFLFPASLGFESAYAVRLSADRPFFVPGLSSTSIGGILPIFSGTALGLSFSSSGNDHLKYFEPVIALGQKVSANCSIGALFKFKHVAVRSLGSFSIPMCGISLRRNFRGWQSGITFSVEKNQVPVNRLSYATSFGIGKDWSEELYTDINFITWSGGKSVFSSFRYLGISAIVIGVSWQSKPGQYAFEAGWQLRGWQICVHSKWHPQIGWSPGISFSYRKAGQL